MSFCRVTGRARNLPKPNFFPIIPPISSGDAQKLCRITGKRSDRHGYLPIIEPGKRPVGSVSKLGVHVKKAGLPYMEFIMNSECLSSPGDIKGFEDLQKILSKFSSDDDKIYVYALENGGLVLCSEIEKAIRSGEIEKISLTKDMQKGFIKVKGRSGLALSLREIEINEGDSRIMNGQGQSKETLSKQKKILQKKKTPVLSGKKFFQDLEKAAKLRHEEEEELERKMSLASLASARSELRSKYSRFKRKYSKNLSPYGSDIRPLLFSSELNIDWEIVHKIKASDLEYTDVPKSLKIYPKMPNFEKLEVYRDFYVPSSIGLDSVPKLEELNFSFLSNIKESLLSIIKDSKELNFLLDESSLSSMFSSPESTAILPPINDLALGNPTRSGVLYDDGNGLKFAEYTDEVLEGVNIIKGAVFGDYFLPGEFDPDGNFFPGQRMTSLNGTFIPGISFRRENESFAFVPGVFNDEQKFIAGQFLNDAFVQGQVIMTKIGPRFLEGQTYNTLDGPKFVAGISTENGEFISGAVMECGTFIEGVLLASTDEELEFIPGVTGRIDKEKAGFIPGQNLKSGFLPGQSIKGLDEKYQFIPGEVIMNKSGVPQFVPGINSPENRDFLPAIPDPSTPNHLIEGKIVSTDGELPSFIFVPGRTVSEKFAKARRENDFSRLDISFLDTPLNIDTKSLLIIKDQPKSQTGYWVSKNGVFSFVTEVVDPSAWDSIEAGKIDGSSKFMAGKNMIINEKEVFIPGQMNGSKFIPGLSIKDNTKFIPGRYISINGCQKFIPGQISKNGEEKPVFLPGKVIETKRGPLFIPGQVIPTDDGLKFVPGQIVETKGSGSLFVPGQVIDSPDQTQFIPGQILETDDGPRLLPSFKNCEFLVQGFDVDPEEADLLLGKSSSYLDLSVNDLRLSDLAKGFDIAPTQTISLSLTQKTPDQLVIDELLNKFDKKAIREEIYSSLVHILDNQFSILNLSSNDLIKKALNFFKDSSIPLNSAIRLGAELLDQSKGTAEKLLQVLLACLPDSLKDCLDSLIELEITLEYYLNESIKTILQDEGLFLQEDLQKNIINLSSLQNVYKKSSEAVLKLSGIYFIKKIISSDSFLTENLYPRIYDILSAQKDLQSGFCSLFKTEPGFLGEIVRSLRETKLTSDPLTSLHRAIAECINSTCQFKLDEALHKVELGNLEHLKSMVNQAMGLANFLGHKNVASLLEELLYDPIRLEVIKDDPVVKDVLNKIFIMRQIAIDDEKKARKLESLQRNSFEEDDESLQDFVNVSSVLIKYPSTESVQLAKRHNGSIKSAKDISMNAFLAMKTKDSTNWLSHFISDSLGDKVPIECSKALIILKEGYQTIVPREASKSILMGESSYTIIDDDGITFFLCPKDKLDRKKGLVQNFSKEPSLHESDQEKADTNQENLNLNALSLEELEKTEKDHNFNSDKYTPKLDLDNFPLADSSLDKYRPHNYECTPRRVNSEDEDINDIRDYYCNLGKRAKGLQRLSKYSSFRNTKSPFSNSAWESHNLVKGPLQPNHSRFLNGNEYQAEDEYCSPMQRTQIPIQEECYEEDLCQPPLVAQDRKLSRGRINPYFEEEASQSMYGLNQTSQSKYDHLQVQENSYSELDESTRLLLSKASSMRNNPIWKNPVTSKYAESEDSPLVYKAQPVENPPPRLGSPPSTLSSKTRGLLNQLRQSTMELEQSNDENHSRSINSYGRENCNYPIEANYFDEHPRNTSRSFKYKDPSPNFECRRQRYSYHPEDEEDFSDRRKNSREYSRSMARDIHFTTPRSNLSRSRNDDDDIDAMIEQLKRKTTGRDMRAVARQIENGNYGSDDPYY